MWWIAVAVIQALYIFSGIRVEQRAGMWTWSKFFFSLGFAGVEWLILNPDTIAHRLTEAGFVDTGADVGPDRFRFSGRRPLDAANHVPEYARTEIGSRTS